MIKWGKNQGRTVTPFCRSRVQKRGERFAQSYSLLTRFVCTLVPVILGAEFLFSFRPSLSSLPVSSALTCGPGMVRQYTGPSALGSGTDSGSTILRREHVPASPFVRILLPGRRRLLRGEDNSGSDSEEEGGEEPAF